MVSSGKFKLEKPVKIRSNESTAHPSRAHSEVSSGVVVEVGTGAVEVVEAEGEGVVVLVLGVHQSAPSCL